MRPSREASRTGLEDKGETLRVRGRVGRVFFCVKFWGRSVCDTVTDTTLLFVFLSYGMLYL